MILKYVYVYIYITMFYMFYVCFLMNFFSNLYLYNTVLSVLFCVNKYIIICIYLYIVLMCLPMES